jgi:hypothetical protein
VLYHSRQIGEKRQADLLVVELFGFLHDSCRENDGKDSIPCAMPLPIIRVARSLPIPPSKPVGMAIA